jgi:hypothetical protein
MWTANHDARKRSQNVRIQLGIPRGCATRTPDLRAFYSAAARGSVFHAPAGGCFNPIFSRSVFPA